MPLNLLGASVGGGISPSSGAQSGASGGQTGAVNVTVGGFNPPALSQLSDAQSLAIAGAALLAVVLWARRK